MECRFLQAGLLALLALSSTGWAVHARSLNEVLAAGELRVGVNPNYPPAAIYNEKNELAGFDVDVSEQLAKMLGVKLTLVVVDPNSRIPFLTSNKIDYVMAGMTRTPDRAKLIDFSVPINTEGFTALTTKNQPYQSAADLNSDKVTFAEVRGTTPVPFIQSRFPNAKLLLLSDWPDAYRAISDGRATVLIEDFAAMGLEIKRLPDVPWRVMPDRFGAVNYDCLGVAKGNDSLRSWLNVALFQIESNGFVNDVWKKWYGMDMIIPVIPQPYF